MWYTREEQSLLNSLWYCMYGVQLMVCVRAAKIIRIANSRRLVAYLPLVFRTSQVDPSRTGSCFFSFSVSLHVHGLS